jgi:hypothetical protein
VITEITPLNPYFFKIGKMRFKLLYPSSKVKMKDLSGIFLLNLRK